MTHLLAASLLADLPVHCLQPQIVGRWTFRLGRPHNTTVSCGHDTPNTNLNNLQKAPEALLQPTASLELELRSPNIARASDGRAGRWTMVYDEGFEVELNGTTFFAFSAYAPKAAQLQSAAASDIYSGGDDLDGYVSHCDRTLLGWYRGAGGRTWAATTARAPRRAPRRSKRRRAPNRRRRRPPTHPPTHRRRRRRRHGALHAAAGRDGLRRARDRRRRQRARRRRWRARPHAQLEGRTVADEAPRRRLPAARRRRRAAERPTAAAAAAERDGARRPAAVARLAADGRLDWDRGARCTRASGSCYAIAVVEMLEARLAIRPAAAADAPW